MCQIIISVKNMCNTNMTPIHEPPHDKTNEMACVPSTDSDLPGHPPSPIRVFAVRMMTHCYPLSAQRRLIRLGGCPGWSESSLGAHAISSVLSWGGSIINFTYNIAFFFLGKITHLLCHTTRKPLLWESFVESRITQDIPVFFLTDEQSFR